MVEHKLVLFATVTALWRRVTLLIKLIRILLKRNTYKTKIMPFWPICCESDAILFKTFHPGDRAGEFEYGKIFILVTEISVAKTEISVTGPARPLI